MNGLEQYRGWLLRLVVALGVLILLTSTWFTIDQTEMGNIRRLGTKVYDQPLGPGLHFKFPLIDTADKLRVTLNTIHIDPFQVSTNDNQVVTLGINYNYTIPRDRVNHLLYEVGGSGSGDIHDQAVAVVKDRAGNVFAGQNMVTVNQNRTFIQNAIETAVHQRLQSLFGIESHSLQISSITPSEAFLTSNEAAVNAKNAAVAAENQKRTKQFEADQVVITAKGQADAVIERARGDAESVRVRAEAEKDRRIAEAKGISAQVQAFGSATAYVDWVRASAWKGEVPTYVGGGAPIPFLNLSK
jgi:modulator of FtsH protease HflC